MCCYVYLTASENGHAWQVRTEYLQQARLTQGIRQGRTVCSVVLHISSVTMVSLGHLQYNLLTDVAPSISKDGH